MNKPEKIDPASGKLGILIPGMGAVATTFIAGVEAIKAGLGEPIGSLTQMGTIRLGKRTENRSPLIKNFVSLASLKIWYLVAGMFFQTMLMKLLRMLR